MRKLIGVSLPIFTAIILFSSVPAYGQDDTARAIMLGQLVELVPEPRRNADDFTSVSVKVGGRVIRRFAANSLIFPMILATFRESDAEYLVYRTFMGQGVCAGGEIFVLKVYRYGQGNVGVMVSPHVEACIGEFPSVSFAFGRGSYVISVSGYEIETETLSRWKEPAPAGNRNRRSR